MAAFAGIGNPAAFRRQLVEAGYQLAAFREFADHHPFNPADITELTTWATQLQVEALICTRKDLVKLPLARLGAAELWAWTIEQEITLGETGLMDLLRPLAIRAQQTSPR